MTDPVAKLTPYGTVLHKRGAWHSEFPVEKLDEKLRFYRKMHERYGHKPQASYDRDVAVLEAVQKELQG